MRVCEGEGERRVMSRVGITFSLGVGEPIVNNGSDRIWAFTSPPPVCAGVCLFVCVDLHARPSEATEELQGSLASLTEHVFVPPFSRAFFCLR